MKSAVTLRRPRTREGAGFQLAILAGVVVYLLISVIGDFTQASVHPEVTRYFLPAAISTGRAWHWQDFGQAFNWELLDHLPRTRFLSYLAFVANTKLRLWLLDSTFLPPAFSFTWLFSFVLAPALVYRLVWNLTASARGSFAGVTLYLCSPGTLSSAVALFHPAKPMAVFSILCCLVWASELEWRSRRQGGHDRVLEVSSWLLLGFMFASMFWDESAWFSLVATPVLFPGLLRSRWAGPHPLLRYALVPVCFLAFVILVAPLIVAQLGFGRYDMLGYLWAPTLNPRSLASVLATSGLNIFGDHFVPSSFGTGTGSRTAVAVCVLAVLSLGSRWLVAGEPPLRRRAVARLVVVTVACAAYQGMLAYKHPGVVDHCFYYASSFSPFLAVAIGVISASSRCTSAMAAAMTLWITAVSLGTFFQTNRAWITDQEAILADVFPEESEAMASPRQLNYDEVVALWRLRNSPDELDAAAVTLPISALWWVTELRALEAPP